MKKFLAFTLILTLFFSCSQPSADISKFSWLSGKWEGSFGEMKTFEEWQPLSGNVMEGRGGVTSGTDTMFAEGIKLEVKEGELYYTAKVPGNPGPVDFKFKGYTNDTAIFENPEHDFPSRVLYFKNADGSLYAKIDGKRGGGYSKEEFSFKKVK